MTRKVKGMKLRVLAAVMALMVLLGVVNEMPVAASGGPEVPGKANAPGAEGINVTEHMNLSLDNLYIERGTKKYYLFKDGKAVPDSELTKDHELLEGNTLQINYKFNVTPDKMQYAKKGNYFEFKLPDQKVLRSAAGTYPLSGLPNTNFVVETRGNERFVKVVFNEVPDVSELKNGIIGVYATLVTSKVTEFEIVPDGSLGFSTSVKFPIKVGKSTAPVGFGKLSQTQDFVKEGYYVKAANEIEYTLRVNFEELRKIYVNRMADPEVKFVQKKNLVIVDGGLSADQTIRPDSLTGTVYVWAPYIDEKNGNKLTTEISNRVILQYNASLDAKKETLNFRSKKFFDVVYKTEDQISWESFQNEIKGKTSRTIGVWNNQKLIINVGTFPADDLIYNELNTVDSPYSDFGKYLEDYRKIGAPNADLTRIQLTQEQVDSMKKVHVGKKVVDFVIRFRAKPVGAVKTDEAYVNSAVMDWKNSPKAINVTRKTITGGAFGSVEMEPFKGEFKVVKKWKGAEKWPVTVHLLKNGVRTGDHVQLSAAKKEHVFSGLKDNEGGNPVKYSVEEDKIDGYKTVITPTPGKYESVITNVEQTMIKVKKNWEDVNGSVLADPNVDKVVVFAHKKSETNPTSLNAVGRLELTAATKWEGTFSLDKLDDSDSPVEYVVKEAKVEGFTTKPITGTMANGFVITNKKEMPKVNLTVTKAWEDVDGSKLEDKDLAGISVKVLVHKDSTPEAERSEANAVATETLTSASSWKHVFNLDGVDSVSGQPINYVVSEVAIPGFTKKEITGDVANGFVITNKKDIPQIQLNVTKKWKDTDGVKDIAPSVNSLKVYVYKKDQVDPKPENAVAQLELKADKSWEGSVTLPAMDAAKNVISYVVAEENVEGYQLKTPIEGTEATGFLLTNVKKLIPSVPDPFTPPFVPVPVPPVFDNPTDPVPTAPIDKPVLPTPDQPKETPVLDPNDDGDEDLEIIGDDVPKGETETDSKKKKKTEKLGKKDKNEKDIDEDESPKGKKEIQNKNILAKTGGLKSVVVPAASLLLLILAAYALVEVISRRKGVKKN